jgi:hypothetical protein
MASPDNPKRVLIPAAQFMLLAIAAACLFYANDNFMIRGAGILAIFASLAITRRSRTLPASPEVRAMQSAWALKPWHWLVGLALVIATAAAYIWLQHDAATGGKSAVPVYVFAAVTLLSACWWAGLFARWQSQRRTQ